MDKLAGQMVELLKDLLGVQERLLTLALARQEAMRAYDMGAMNGLLERERGELAAMESVEKRRTVLVEACRRVMGRGANPTTSEIAGMCKEPTRTQILVLSGKSRGVIAKLERANRINVKVSTAVVASISRVLKIVTGIAQHAGLYMSNGRKASVHGIHLLDAVA